VIVFLPASRDFFLAGRNGLVSEAEQIAHDAAEELQRLSSLSQTPLPIVSGQTLSAAQALTH
jgi:hypothetical protein